MKKRVAILVARAVAMTVVSGGVYADTIRPIQGKRIDLGTFGGVAYYTVERDGYHLVVTLTPSGPRRPSASSQLWPLVSL
jgi:hypothetical protein